MYYNYTSVASCVLYLFLGMQMKVLSIIYGWAIMVLCIHLTSGVVGAIKIISIDKEYWISFTHNLK